MAGGVLGTARAPENGLTEGADGVAYHLVHRGCAGLLEAAANLTEHFTDLASTDAGFPGNELDHRAAPG